MKTIQIMMISAVSVLFMQSVFAQDWVWTGAVDNNFSTAGNWLVDGSVPAEGPSDTSRLNFVFDGAAGGTVNLDRAQVVASITFGSNAGEYVFTGSNDFLARPSQHNNDNLPITINQNSSSTQTFNNRRIGRINNSNFNFTTSGATPGNIIINAQVETTNGNDGVGYSVNGPNRVSIGNTQLGNRNINFFSGDGTLEITGSASNRIQTINSSINTLLVNNSSGNALGTRSLLVENNSRLAGGGTISGGTVTIQNGGILTPGQHGNNPVGSSIGTLTTSNLTLEDGFVYNWEFTDSTSDRFIVSDVLDVSAANDLSVVNLIGDMADFDPLSNNVLFTFDSIVGASDGQVLSWQINHNDVDSGYFAVVSGNDVLVAIPEPGTLALIGIAGIAGLLGLRRRRS